MEDDGVVKAESDFGTFSVVSRKTYKFDDELTSHLKEYKKSIEKEAIETSRAEEQITNSLRYTNAKNTYRKSFLHKQEKRRNRNAK
jgi:hypothetical protein